VFFWDKHFVLGVDVDMSDTMFSRSPIGYSMACKFPGYVGGICGYNRGNGLIDNCHISGTVTGGGDDIGGVCGKIDIGSYGTPAIQNCSFEGQVTGVNRVGGLCGYNLELILNSCFSGDVVGIGDKVGGVCGRHNGRSRNCFSMGTVTGDDYVGGFVGWNLPGEIKNCYSSSTVNGDERVAGFCGTNSDGTIINCYSSGSATGNYRVGGFCGFNFEGSIIGSYWNETDSMANMSSGGELKTTEQMKDISTYLGWNDGSWIVDSGNGYPRLSWEGSVGVSITTDYPAKTYTGIGTSQDPYVLSNPDDLICMSQRAVDWESYFVLGNDIDMSQVSCYQPVVLFEGTLDGHAHVVSNVVIDEQELKNNCQLGFVMQNDGVIKNLGIENVYVNGEHYTGGLCGHNNGTLSNCYTTGLVTGYSTVGGLCGINIFNYHQQDDGIVTNSYSSVNVTGESRVGGLCGRNAGSVSYCYSTGLVIGNDSAGGFCGRLEKGVNTGADGSIENCFWDIETSGQETGYVQNASNPGTITNLFGKSTLDMQIPGIYTDSGWDFVVETVNGEMDYWYMPSSGYPKLWWQYSLPQDSNIDGVVDSIDLVALCQEWMLVEGDIPDYRMKSDFNHDGTVDLKDFLEQSSLWLKSQN